MTTKWFVGKKYRYGMKTYKTKSKAVKVAKSKKRKYVGWLKTTKIRK